MTICLKDKTLTIEECFNLLGINQTQEIQINNDSCMDTYGNYVFPTDVKLDEQNSAIGFINSTNENR